MDDTVSSEGMFESKSVVDLDQQGTLTHKRQPAIVCTIYIYIVIMNERHFLNNIFVADIL